MNKDFNPIVEKINSAKSIVLLVHEIPDGDAVGSIIAMNLALKGMGKNIDAFIEKVPGNCEFLLNDMSKDIITFDKADMSKKYDLCIVLDCGNLERTGDAKIVFENANNTACIDHHCTNQGFADVNYIDENAAATGEIVFELLNGMGIKLNDKIATALYAAISSDTGNFEHNNTTKRTFEIAGELMKYGINNSQISYYLFLQTSLDRLKFMGNLIQNIEICLDGKVGILIAKKEDMGLFGITDGDLEGMVDYSRYVKGVEVGILIKPVKDLFKASMRSNGKIDVVCIAQKFNGGGHKFAAGCKFNVDSAETAKNMLLEELAKVL